MTEHTTPSPLRQRAGSFASITEAMLRDTAALLVWREANLGNAPSQADQLFVVAAAERALEKGTNKAALFVTIVKGDFRELITCAQDDRAARRLREHCNQALRYLPEVKQLMEKLTRRIQENK